MSEISSFIDMGFKQARLFKINPEAYLSVLVKDGSQRRVMNNIYFALVADKRITPIEKLPLAEQWEWRKQAEADAAGSLGVPQIKDLARSLYAITYLVNNC